MSQPRGYHVELSDGTSGYIVLVNDSSKEIEAYHFKASCENSRMEFFDDALAHPRRMGRTESVPTYGLGRIVGFRSDYLQPGQRLTAGNRLDRRSGCTWKADIDAVIYSDGSYEGPESVVHAIQLRRRGIAAAVKYWMNRRHSDPDLIRTDAKRFSSEWCSYPSVQCYYRQGRQWVDSIVAARDDDIVRNSADNPTAEERSRRQKEFIEGWQRKIEDDVALKRLDSVFPLPPDLVNFDPAEDPSNHVLTPLLP